MTSDYTAQLALSGLLHDIGKFMLRAAVGGDRIWDEEAQRDFGYKHAMLSAAFIEDFVPSPWRVAVKNMAGNHHRPRLGSREELIVSLADNLSAAERDDGIEDDNPRQQHPRQLLSIFSVLEAEGIRLSGSQRRYMPLRPLSLRSETLFPCQSADAGEVWRAYADLWQGFAREIERLKGVHEEEPDLSSYLESVLLLMQRYLWCVPSAYYRSLPDISLYDHSRVAAALAAVLDCDTVDAETLTGWRKAPQSIETEIALLVGGDISGVQNFIYTITARGAAPTLRGRSFYLQILTEAIARYLIRRLGLPSTNLIYSGGGSFFLLARPGDSEQLPRLQQEISRLLLKQHHGELYMALAGVFVAGRELSGQAMSRKWGELHDALRRKKLRRFAEMDQELAALFEPSGRGGNEERLCQVCGQEHQQTAPLQEDADVEPVRKCPPCRAFEELGDDLRNARYLLLDEIDLHSPAGPSAFIGDWRQTLAHLGLMVEICEKAPETRPQNRRLLLALDDEGLSRLSPRSRTATGRRFFVNAAPVLGDSELEELRNDRTFSDREELPRSGGGIKPFSVLAYQSSGISRLGILRMDVDNLGQIFQTGFGEGATLSRMAALSFAVSLYFDGWVSRVVEKVNRMAGPDGARIYTIYSGGDDLFFTGSWDAMLELALRIRADLTAYAGGHPGIHASAGVVLIGGKYPLSQAAQEADTAEKAAKGLIWRNGEGEMKEKDAISFLGTPLPWSTFGLETSCAGSLDTAHGLMHTLVSLCREGEGETTAPRALVRTLIDLDRQHTEAQDRWRNDQADDGWSGPDQALLGPWIWRSAYALQRLYDRSKVEEALRIKERLPVSGYRLLEYLGVSARWADLALRRRE